VIIPCHNGGRYLAEAIDSALAQTYEAIEVIVVDDGSTDDTPVIANAYSAVRCIRQANEGLAAARNTGLGASHGTFCLFVDADDRLPPEALATGVALLESKEDCAFVSGTCTLIAPDGSSLFTPAQLLIDGNHYRELLRSSYIWTIGAVLHRREALIQVDGFDLASTIRGVEDYDLYLRLASRFPVTAHPEVVVEYRQHAGSMSMDSALMLASVHNVLERQRPCATDPEHAAALAAGVQWYADYYDHPLLRTIRARWNHRLAEIEPLLCSRADPEGKEPLLDELRRLYKGMLTAFGLTRTIRGLEGSPSSSGDGAPELRSAIEQLDAYWREATGAVG
jgi:glycosyltransferase involved in cell wall biosynthesis